MIYSIKNRKFGKKRKIGFITKSIKVVRLQDKLGEQICDENIKDHLKQLLIQLKIPPKI